MGQHRGGRHRGIYGLAMASALALAAVSTLSQAAATPSAPPAPPVAAPAPAPAPAAPGTDMSSIFGPGSSLQAAPDGEFNIQFGEDNQLSTFHAVKDVLLVTKDIDLKCDEMDFDKARGFLVATAQKAGNVDIKMRGAASPAGPAATSGGTKNDTRATCGHFEYYLDGKKYVLTGNPVIYQRDSTGKETAIVGDRIEVTQDEQGRTKMNVKGRPSIGDPKRSRELEAIRHQMSGTSKPVLSVDTNPPRVPSPPAVPGKAARLDEGNIETVKQPKSTRVINLEEGG